MPDRAGNTVQVVLDVLVHRDKVRARFVSIRYNDGLVVKAPGNLASFRTNRHGKSLMINQRLLVGDGRSAVRVSALFDARRNTTTIWTVKSRRPGRIVQAGLVLIKLATAMGTLSVEY